MAHRLKQQRVKGRSEVLPAVGRGGGEGPVAAALGRPCGWEQWSGVPTHAGHMVEARLVVPVAMGRGGSKRSVVAAAGVMVVQRRRWARDGADDGGRDEGSGTRKDNDEWLKMTRGQRRNWRRQGGRAR